jgi:5'(3')-deoxyribonucleotidase
MSRKIYLDIDGVVADIVGRIVQLGFPIPKTYTFQEYNKTDRLYLKNLFDTPNFNLSLNVLPSAKDAVDLLEKLDLFGGFLTSRTSSKEVITSTKKWLTNHGFSDNVIFRKDKHEYLKEVNALGIVEDNPLIVPLLKKYNIVYVIVSCPYNEGVLPRANNTLDAVKKLIKILQKGIF